MKQILIVEDDSFLNKMLSYNLTADGYGVTSALNFRTAAEAIRQREFDLILLDVNLPFRRTAAACGDCPRSDYQTGYRAGRRADRQP